MAAELRRFLRLSVQYRLEYGPFPLTGGENEIKSSLLRNIGGGGLMFLAEEPLSSGQQLVLKVFITGWRLDGDDIVEAPDEDTEVPITAIAEVTHCEDRPVEGGYPVGVRFLGRILS